MNTANTNDAVNPVNMFLGEDESMADFEMSFTTTARAKWENGYFTFGNKGENNSHFVAYDPNDKEAGKAAYQAVAKYVTDNNLINAKGVERKPLRAIHMTIAGDDVPSHPQGRYEWGDVTETYFFIFDAGKAAIPVIGTALANLKPPTLTPFGKFQWCKLEKVPDAYRTSQGEMNEYQKKDDNKQPMFDENGAKVMVSKPHEITLPIAVYPTREAAIADMDKAPEPENGITLSEKAAESYTPSSLMSYKDEIKDAILARVNDANEPVSLEDATKEIAESWVLEVGDIEQLGIEF